MGPRLGYSVKVETGVGLRVDPRLILNSTLLQLASTELEAAIETELSENPALERIEELEGIEDNDILRAVAPCELKERGDDWERTRGMPQEGEQTWLDLAAATTSLTDHLLAELLPQVPKDLTQAAVWLIGSLDDRGYLQAGEEDLALANDISLEQALWLVKKLHNCNPPGIGARNLRECLLLQLRAQESLESRLAQVIVRRHLEEIGLRKVGQLSRKYRVLPNVVEMAFDLISTLTPFPAETFQPFTGGIANSVRVRSVLPDLRINRSEQGWSVDLGGTDPSAFAIDRFYSKRLESLKSGSDKKSSDAKGEIRHLAMYVQRAEQFIDALEQRKQTMLKLGAYLVANQSGFLSTGDYAFLKSMTRTQMAKDIGVHESTISRATAGKFVQLATGEVISFEIFFKPALRVQKMIEEILGLENPNEPLSDERIASLLADKGVFVARRTVNKYRDRTKLLSSRRRKVA